MAVKIAFDQSQLNALERAIARNPKKIRDEVQLFLTRGMALYKGYIIRNPWRMSGTGGGAPVAFAHGGNLRDTHSTRIGLWSAKISPTASYAKYVHDGTFKMDRRPWLDYAQRQGDGEIDNLGKKLLDNLVKDFVR